MPSALNPNISLGVNPPQPIDFTKFAQLKNLAAQNEAIYQQIEASKTAQKAQEAQIPGLAAESERLRAVAEGVKQDQAANDYMIQVGSTGQFRKEDGSADMPKLIGEVSKKFPKQSMVFAKSHYDQAYQQELARAQAATATGNEAETAGKLNRFSNDATQTLANVIAKSNIPDAEKGAAFQEALKRQALHYPEAFKNSPYVTIVPGTPENKGPDGNVIPAKPPTVELKAAVTAGDVQKIANGSMTPLISAELEISRNRLDLERLRTDLNYQEAQKGQMDAGTRAELQAKAIAERDIGKRLELGANANVSGIGAGGPGDILQETWKRAVARGGPATQLQASLDAYNAKRGTQYTIWGHGVDAIKDLLREESKIHYSNADGYLDVAQPKPKGGVPNVGGKKTPEPGPAPAPSNQQGPPPGYAPGSIQMRKGTSIRWIDASKIDKAKADGFKLLSEK